MYMTAGKEEEALKLLDLAEKEEKREIREYERRAEQRMEDYYGGFTD